MLNPDHDLKKCLSIMHSLREIGVLRIGDSRALLWLGDHAPPSGLRDMLSRILTADHVPSSASGNTLVEPIAPVVDESEQDQIEATIKTRLQLLADYKARVRDENGDEYSDYALYNDKRH